MSLTKEQKDELVTSYAALALYDGDAEISSQQLNELIAATGNEVEPYWPILFAKFLNGKVEQLIASGGATGGGGGGAAAPAGGDAAAPAGGDDKKKEKEKKEEEEADLGGAMDMFGGGGDGY